MNKTTDLEFDREENVGIQGACAPSPHPMQLLGMNDQDPLIEQSVTVIKQSQCLFGSVVFCETINEENYMYFNFVVLLLLPSPTMPFFCIHPFQESATPLSKLCTTITDQHEITPTLILALPQALPNVLYGNSYSYQY